MKKIFGIALICMAALMAYPTGAMAEPASILGGAAVGYDWAGPSKGTMNTLIWCAPRVKTINKDTYVYAGYQYGEVGEVTQHGGKLMLVEKSHIPHLWFIFDAGWLNRAAEDGPGLTVGGGVAYGITKRMSLIVYGMAIDRGEDFGFAAYAAVGVDDLWGMANEIIN